MGPAREKWDKKKGEMRRMRLAGLDVKMTPDSAVAGKSRQSQMGRCQSVSITTDLNKALQEVGNSRGQSGGSPDSSIACPDSTRWCFSISGPP